jgi:hypothetical protein
VIERGDISDVVYYEKKYYHEDCFCELCNKRIASKRGNPASWQEALDSLWVLEAETKKMLEHYWSKDDLNNWLLEHYDIAMVPTRFWQVISDLEAGKYKGKRCKPISITTLYGCWKWGQKKLNEINQYNKSHNKGPTDDSTRLMYDLAILVGKVPNYLAYKEKQKAAEIERRREIKENLKVDYSKVANNRLENNNLQDISNLVDDIF